MTRWAPQRFRVSSPPSRPLLLFDGDCGFCRYWVDRWRGTTSDRVDYAPSQLRRGDFPEISEDVYARSVVLLTPDGEAFTGAEAVFRALATVPAGRMPYWLYRHMPGFGRLAEAFYGHVAGHRAVFSRITRVLWGTRSGISTFSRSRCLFVRLIALVYLAAFLSLGVQIDGLVGEHGILPMKPWLEAVHHQLGAESYRLLPTLLWIHPSDALLEGVCGGGALVAALVAFGLAPAPLMIVLWAFYLSLVLVGRDFLGFQWDALLLETGFLAAFLAPFRWRCALRCPRPAPRLPFWLLRWLLFRLMLSSGIVKLSSGDPTWRDLTALTYHFETQPLPIWTSWYVHHLPATILQVFTLGMFFIELIVPFTIFGPRRIRMTGFWMLISLQLFIGATGNYAYFNLLTIALCFLLVDDGSWTWLGESLRSGLAWILPSRALRRRLRLDERSPSKGAVTIGHAEDREGSAACGAVATDGVIDAARDSCSLALPTFDDPRPSPVGQTKEMAAPPFSTGGRAPWRSDGSLRHTLWSTWLFAPIALAVFLVGTAELVATLGTGTTWPAPIVWLEDIVRPFNTVNGYGLFAVMTTSRREIIIEGSRDGTTWLPYEFQWKPGDVGRRPALVAPHQPRLDWQMWFAALGDYRASPWFLELLGRLLEGSPPVLKLLRTNPFPDQPPTYVRAELYDYHFTSAEDGRKDGSWWRRERLGDYCPAVSLRSTDEDR